MDLREHKPGAAALFSLLARGKLSLTVDDLPFTLTGLPWRKRLNVLLGGAQKMLRPPFRLGLPLILQVEPTNTCNLQCPACATGSGLMTRKPARMPWETYVRVIDEVRPYACIVFFWSWGEPFLHPDACRMIRYAKDQGLTVHSCTNGHCFADPGKAVAVVASGLDSLIFAVDGLDAATYATYRRGGNLETVLTSIRNVVRAREAAGGKLPLLAIRFIVMKHNEHQLADVETFAKDLGVDAVTWRTPLLAQGGRQFADSLAPDNPGYRRDAGSDSAGPIRQRCNRPFANLTVFSGGEVVFCENDYNAQFALGQFDGASLRALLSSAPARKMLRGFRHGTSLPAFCSTCEFRHSRKPTFNVTTKFFPKDRG
jgi:pyruvate-formate lyase-activating enzyme